MDRHISIKRSSNSKISRRFSGLHLFANPLESRRRSYCIFRRGLQRDFKYDDGGVLKSFIELFRVPGQILEENGDERADQLETT